MFIDLSHPCQCLEKTWYHNSSVWITALSRLLNQPQLANLTNLTVRCPVKSLPRYTTPELHPSQVHTLSWARRWLPSGMLCRVSPDARGGTYLRKVSQFLPDYRSPGDSHLHTRRPDNLKYYNFPIFLSILFSNTINIGRYYLKITILYTWACFLRNKSQAYYL
jgi:hypothetical protein